MLKISCAGCLGLSPAILVQFTLEVRVAAQNREKFTKTLYFGDQGHSKSSMLTFLRSSLPVLVIISSISVPICNHFHVRRANNGRITLFNGGTPLSPPRSWEPPLPSGMKFCHKILETLSYHMAKTRSLLSHLCSDRYWVMTDTKTPRQTQRQNYHS